MSTYARLVDLLSDHQWHDRNEIAAITHYPDLWLKELARGGPPVVRKPDGTTQVRLADERPLVGGLSRTAKGRPPARRQGTERGTAGR